MFPGEIHGKGKDILVVNGQEIKVYASYVVTYHFTLQTHFYQPAKTQRKSPGVRPTPTILSNQVEFSLMLKRPLAICKVVAKKSSSQHLRPMHPCL
jgi:hypothetical protein